MNCNRIDFSNPLQNRKWLNLLVDDPLSGIRIKPNLDLNVREMGFSFKSNRLGLRGPAETSADTVVFGTSYAMGFGVNVGKNWYDYLNTPFLNLGIPVGPQEELNLLNQYYEGNGKKGLYLYHPNFWYLSYLYKCVKDSGKSVFEVGNWKTKYFDCLKLMIAIFRNRINAQKQGKIILSSIGGIDYKFQSGYCFHEFDVESDFANYTMNSLLSIATKFDEFIIIRLPIKEQLAPISVVNSKLAITRDYYDFCWDIVRTHLSGCCKIYEPDIFDLKDYLPKDTHWGESGNYKFYEYVKQFI